MWIFYEKVASIDHIIGCSFETKILVSVLSAITIVVIAVTENE
jgi:hypothetical protein